MKARRAASWRNGAEIKEGLLSDHFSHVAMQSAGASEMTEAFKAVGLHDAMYLIPMAFILTMLALLQASRCFVGDAAHMGQQQQARSVATA